MQKLYYIMVGLPSLFYTQAIYPLQVAWATPLESPTSQKELASLVDQTRIHEIRAGYTHRFIRLMFVSVGSRVFCRRYQYTEPSWHSVFLSDPKGQVRLDNTVANIEARVPEDQDVIPAVDEAYAKSLKKLGALFLLEGATEPRAQESTLEIFYVDPHPEST